MLPYLEVIKDNETEENKLEEVIVPNIVGMTIQEAEKELKNVELGMSFGQNNSEEVDKQTAIVKTQLPKYGIKVYKNTNIIVETE